MASELGQSLKNGILFGLVILIFHIAIKATLEQDTFANNDDTKTTTRLLAERDGQERDGQEREMYAMATSAVAAAAAATGSTPGEVQEAALREYVFGDGDAGAPAPASAPAPAPASTAAPAPAAAPAPTGAPAPTAAPAPTGAPGAPPVEKFAGGSFATVGHYANESELCGGSMKGSVGGRAGDLKGFDGFFSSCVGSVL